jgi:predicted transcriptional regulator
MEVLKVLWELGPSTVRQVNDSLGQKGRKWAYTTVLTLLQRLQAKGCVASQTGSMAHVFHALATRDDLVRDRLQDLANELCEGAPAPLLLALVQGHKFSREEIARFRALLEGQDRRRTSPKK